METRMFSSFRSGGPIIGVLLATLAASSVCATTVPVVSVTALATQTSESGPAVALLFTREADIVDKSLVVPFTLSGTATAGADYSNPGQSVTFTPNSPMVSLRIVPLKDAIVEGPETVVLTLTPQPGMYTFGENRSATIVINDAAPHAGNNASGGAPSGIVDPPSRTGVTLPAPDHSGTLTVSITFDGTGTWKHPSNGAYSNMKFHRELNYILPLAGYYGAGSGFTEIDRREPITPDFQHFLVGRPRDATAAAGTPCGRGKTVVADTSSGMEVGDPGQPPLVPFTQQVRGGGNYPSGDRTVPERDLCLTLLSFDNEKHRLHLRLDGTDAHVKVVNTHNGHSMPAYNLRLQGDEADTKAKFTFFDIPVPADAISAVGTRTLHDVGTVAGPMNTHYPLTATVQWRIEMH